MSNQDAKNTNKVTLQGGARLRFIMIYPACVQKYAALVSQIWICVTVDGRNLANHLGCIKPCKSWEETTNLNWWLPDVWTNSISFRGCYFIEDSCQPWLAIFIMRKPTVWGYIPGDSSRDLVIPSRWRSLIYWKGHGSPSQKRSPAELPCHGVTSLQMVVFSSVGKGPSLSGFLIKGNIRGWISKIFMRCPDILRPWGTTTFEVSKIMIL